MFWSILIVFISKYDKLAAAVNDNELRHIRMTTIYLFIFIIFYGFLTTKHMNEATNDKEGRRNTEHSTAQAKEEHTQ